MNSPARNWCWAPQGAGVALLIVAAVIGCATSARADAGLHAFASAHYRIHTDLPRRQIVPFGRHMDLLFTQYEKRFAQFGDDTPSQLPVYLLSTEERYLSFMKHVGIAARNSGGMFFVTRDNEGVATWADGRSPSQTRRTLQHEGFHQFAHDHFGRNLPAWLNEGLAQYFEDAILLDRGFALGLADPDRIQRVRQALDAGDALPLASLLRLGGTDWHSTLTTDATRAGLLYAQSWSLVYFLIHGDQGAHQPAFEHYLQLLSEDASPDRALKQAFGDNAMQDLEARWKPWARRQLPDAVTVAAGRLAFLGEALAYKASRQETMPKKLGELESDLRARGFAMTRTVHNLDLEYRADQPARYTYTRPGGEVSRFQLLEPSRSGLPPRIAAPGLNPEPNLIWERDGEGNLAYDITYR